MSRGIGKKGALKVSESSQKNTHCTKNEVFH